MNLITPHHHYKQELIEPTDRVARCERYVIDLLLSSSLSDAERDSSAAFELKHHHGATQMARILARKRGLPSDVCAVGMLLHDIYVIIDGKYKDHAHLGAPLAVQIVSEIGGFSSAEIDQIRRMVYHHSDKHIWSDDPFQEIAKDADVLEVFLYPNPLGDYLVHKSLYALSHYLNRARRVFEELRIPEDLSLDLLENYGPSWFQPLMASSPHSLQPLLSLLIALSEFDKQDGVCAPAFCLVASDARLVFCTNRGNWEEYVKRLRRAPSLSAFGRSDRVPDALNLPLTQDAEAKKIVDLLERIPSSLISERVREQAGQLLSLAIERQQVLVFWPLADVYEALEGERRSARLEELGIAVHSVLAGGGSHEEDS